MPTKICPSCRVALAEALLDFAKDRLRESQAVVRECENALTKIKTPVKAVTR